MTVEELLARAEIHDTIARYNLAGDRGRIDQLAACFCPDGILEVRGAWRASGRDEIQERLLAVIGAAASGAGSAVVRHHATTHRAELDSETQARAWTYFLVVTGQGLDHAGRYVDRFCKVFDRWLIAHRRVDLDWRVDRGGVVGPTSSTEGIDAD